MVKDKIIVEKVQPDYISAEKEIEELLNKSMAEQEQGIIELSKRYNCYQSKLRKILNEKIKVKKYKETSEQKKGVTPVTPVTSVTSVTPVTSSIPELGVTVVTCNSEILNSLFGEETIDQILKLYACEIKVNKPLSAKNLADSLGKSEATIKMTISRNKEFFGKIGKKGSLFCYTLLHPAIEEIESRIKAKIAEIEYKTQIQRSKENAKKEAKDYEESLMMFARSSPPERDGKAITLDFQRLVEFEPKMADSLLNNPLEFISNYKKAFSKDYEIRIINLPKHINQPIEKIRKENLNKIITVEGRITSFGEVKPVITLIKFECRTCGTITKLLQNYRDGSISYPSSCMCSNPKHQIVGREEVNACFLQLEDLQEKTDNPHSQRIKAVIFNGLCEPERISIFSPGNEVRCTGLLKEVPIKKAGKKTLFLSWILEIWDAEMIDKEVNIDNLNNEELCKIKELSASINNEGLNALLPSFAPEVYGYENIKSALALSLCNKRNDKKKNASRNKSNILLIGDPGVAKSVLCDFTIDVTHGARKAVGGGSSAVGITASVVKEEDSLGGYRVEPGAMVLAKELLFIDELNNLPEDDKPKLQEGMNEQTISINKANLHVKMKVTGGVIAAANPKGGHFIISNEQPIEEQFNIPTPILNRFDSIFVITDELNEENDKKIAQRMIQRHRGTLVKSYDKEFLRKFFTFIRHNDEPIIDDKMEQVLQQVYSLARKYNSCRVKINPRFLESLTRMCIASAKIRQSSKIELKDIENSIKILADTEYKVNPYLLTKLL